MRAPDRCSTNIRSSPEEVGPSLKSPREQHWPQSACPSPEGQGRHHSANQAARRQWPGFESFDRSVAISGATTFCRRLCRSGLRCPAFGAGMDCLLGKSGTAAPRDLARICMTEAALTAGENPADHRQDAPRQSIRAGCLPGQRLCGPKIRPDRADDCGNSDPQQDNVDWCFHRARCLRHGVGNTLPVIAGPEEQGHRSSPP